MRLIFLLAASLAAQGTLGISTRFVDVEIEDVEPGRDYNVLEKRGLPYRVVNRGDAATEVRVSALSPAKGEVSGPYEPLPDAGWVKFEPEKRSLGPGEAGDSAIILRLPDDPSLRGRHFQAVLWARTEGAGPLAAGVKTTLRFSVGKNPKTLAEQERQRRLAALRYEVTPSRLHVAAAHAGRYKGFTIKNLSDSPLRLEFSAAPWPRSALPPGFEAAQDLGWVRFSPEKLTLKRGKSRKIKLLLDVPEALRGRRLAFSLRLIVQEGLAVDASNRVLLEVAGQP